MRTGVTIYHSTTADLFRPGATPLAFASIGFARPLRRQRCAKQFGRVEPTKRRPPFGRHR